MSQVVEHRGFATPEDKLRQAIDAFQSQIDNRLLRAWEYSLASMAETGWAAERVQAMAMDFQKALTHDNPAYFKMIGSADLAAYNEATDRAVALFKQRTRLLYDASALRTTDSDGHSTYGGFVVQRRDGEGDRWRPIADIAEFNRHLGAILKATTADPKALPISSEFSRLMDSALQAIQKNSSWFSGLDSKQSHPLRIPSGGSPQAVLRNYFGQNARVEETFIASASGLSLLGWLVEKLRDHGGQAPVSVPIGNDRHTFLLKPRVTGRWSESGAAALNLAEAAKAEPLGPWLLKHLADGKNGLILGDSNWARGDSHIYFALRHNPRENDFSLWQSAYDGARFTWLSEIPSEWIAGKWRLYLNLDG